MKEINFANQEDKVETTCHWIIAFTEKVGKNQELFKRIEHLKDVIFDDDINSSILDHEPMCELIQMIGGQYVDYIIFDSAVIGLKLYIELNILKDLCAELGNKVVIDLSQIKVFSSYELDDITDEMMIMIRDKMLELILIGFLDWYKDNYL